MDFLGTANDDNFVGTDDDDTFSMELGGNDTVAGEKGDDTFLFGSQLTALDSVGGGKGHDELALDGDYSAGVAFTVDTLNNVELLSLAGGNSYDFTIADGTVDFSERLTVDAADLGSADQLTLDGSAGIDGVLRIIGGDGRDLVAGGGGPDKISGNGGNDHLEAGRGDDLMRGNAGADKLSGNDGADKIKGEDGDDRITGGLELDLLSGGAGSDTFVYNTVAQSTNEDYDTILGFAPRHDFIHLDVAVTGIDAMITTGSLTDGATYVTDFETAVNSDTLAASHAVIWVPDAGEEAGETYLVIDVNGVAGFQSAQDYIIELDDAAHLADLTLANFT